MAVLLETSKGDVVVDLFVDDAPKTCLNFVKLCKLKYYNHCGFFDVQGFHDADGRSDEHGERRGVCVRSRERGPKGAVFEDEIHPTRRRKDGPR